MFPYVHIITPALMHAANMVNIGLMINCLLNAKHQDPIQEFYINRLHNIKEQNRELVQTGGEIN